MNVNNKKPSITISNFSKCYGDIKAVDNINLTLSQGNIYAILGPNGSGKTTLLRAILGLITPSDGSIKIFEQSMNFDNLSVRRHIAVVPDDDDLIEDLTPVEYLRFVGVTYEMPKNIIDKRIDDILKLMALTNYKNIPIKKFSHGMRKKVQFASALLPDVKIYIIDEPTNGLDPDVTILVKKIISSLRSSNKIVILATHNLNFAEGLADQVIFLKSTVIKTGTVGQILKTTRASSLEGAYMSLTNYEINHELLHQIVTSS